jgi:hypothetical protein
MGGTFSTLGSKKVYPYNIFVIKSQGNNSLERPMHRWKANIRVDLKKQNVNVWTLLN